MPLAETPGAGGSRSLSLPQFGRENGQPGDVAQSSRGWQFNTVTLATARSYGLRYVPSRRMVVRAIQFQVTTAAAPDVEFDVGIDDNMGSRIVSLGATLGQLNTTGIKPITLPTATLLRPGRVYYIKFSHAAVGATVPVLTSVFWPQSGPVVAFGSGLPLVEAGVHVGQHPLSAVATFVPGLALNVPALWLLE